MFILFLKLTYTLWVKIALKLIELAAQANADAIKFQLCDHNRLIMTKNVMFSYDILVNKKIYSKP